MIEHTTNIRQGTAEAASAYAMRLAITAAGGDETAASCLREKCVGDNAHQDNWAIDLARDPAQMSEVFSLLGNSSNRGAVNAGLQIVTAILNVNYPSVPGEWCPQIYRALVAASDGLPDVPALSGSDKMVRALPPVANVLYYFASGYPERMAQIFELFSQDLSATFLNGEVPRGLELEMRSLLEQVGETCRLEPPRSLACIEGLIVDTRGTKFEVPALWTDGTLWQDGGKVPTISDSVVPVNVRSWATQRGITIAATRGEAADVFEDIKL